MNRRQILKAAIATALLGDKALARIPRGACSGAVGSTCAGQTGSSTVHAYFVYQGTTTGGGTTTLIDSTQSWTTNQWVGYRMTCYTSGGGNGYEASTITSNTATTLTFGAISPNGVTSGKSYGIDSDENAFPLTLNGNSVTTGSQFAQTLYGTKPQQYSVNLDAFGAEMAVVQWSNSATCLGAAYGWLVQNNPAPTLGSGAVFGYPNICRGWTNASSTTQAVGYTTSVGMGVQLSAMTQALVHVHLANYPTAANTAKYDFLHDVYWYVPADPATLGTPFPPQIDIQVFTAVLDETNFGFGYDLYAYNACTKTISGNTYDVIISSVGSSDWGSGFSTSSGYTCTFMLHPTSLAGHGITPPGPQLFGAASATHDLYAMATWLAGLTTASRDDNNAIIKNASGVQVAASNSNVPMSTAFYLGAVNTGPEVYFDSVNFDPWEIDNYWVAMQSESPGPSSP